jgi:hypothetical protein
LREFRLRSRLLLPSSLHLAFELLPGSLRADMLLCRLLPLLGRFIQTRPRP